MASNANVNTSEAPEQSIATSSSDVPAADTLSKRSMSTRSSSSHISIISTYMKKVSTSPTDAKPKLSLQSLQEQINKQNDFINHQTQTINQLIEKTATQEKQIDSLHREIRILNFQIDETSSRMVVKDIVSDRLKEEVQKLRQYTRRYSVTVSGIGKVRDEDQEKLGQNIEGLLKQVNSTTSMADVDKFHRNGPINDRQQDIIIRFKSHSAKENFYKARKPLQTQTDIRIRPSLSDHNVKLLKQSRNAIDELDKDIMSNPPEFVLANMHGDIQVKFQKKSSRGLFVTFNSLQGFYRVVANAQAEDAQKVYDEDFSKWSDKDDDSDFEYEWAWLVCALFGKCLHGLPNSNVFGK